MKIFQRLLTILRSSLERQGRILGNREREDFFRTRKLGGVLLLNVIINRIHPKMDTDDVICIVSSDEESPRKSSPPKSNDVNSIKNNGKEHNPQKRKLSDACGSSDETLHVEKKVKLSLNSSETENHRNSPSCDEKKRITPQLIVKEKKTVQCPDQDVFPMFLSLCLQKRRDSDMHKIIEKLKRRFEELDPGYATSEEFIMLLNEKRDIISTRSKEIYTHIRDVMEVMKSKKNRGVENLQNHHNVNGVVKKEETHKSPVREHSDDENTVDDRKYRRLRKIEKTMEKCEKIIKNLEAKEVDFDEEDDSNSNYIKLERYKERMVELYVEYCKLTGDNIDAGRPYLRPKHFNATQIGSVDQAITSFINSKITQRNQSWLQANRDRKKKKVPPIADAIIFPDYKDILKCVEMCNERNNLGLSSKRQRTIAEKGFKELGDYLQRMRREDYWDTFSLYLDAEDNDPAIKDKELASRLQVNRKIGDKNLKDVFEHYAKQQEESKRESEEEGDSNESLEDDEEEDEEEEEQEEDEDEEEEENEKETPNGENNEREDLSEDQDDREAEDEVQEGEVEVEVEAENDKELNTISANSPKEVSLISSPSPVPEEIQGFKSEDSFSCSKLPRAETDSENYEADVEIVEIPEEGAERLQEKSPESEEAKNPPQLRVRSFAKPPESWNDEKNVKPNENMLNVTEAITCGAANGQITLLPAIRKTVIIPSNLGTAVATPRKIIKVNNITKITNKHYINTPSKTIKIFDSNRLKVIPQRYSHNNNNNNNNNNNVSKNDTTISYQFQPSTSKKINFINVKTNPQCKVSVKHPQPNMNVLKNVKIVLNDQMGKLNRVQMVNKVVADKCKAVPGSGNYSNNFGNIVAGKEIMRLVPIKPQLTNIVATPTNKSSTATVTAGKPNFKVVQQSTLPVGKDNIILNKKYTTRVMNRTLEVHNSNSVATSANDIIRIVKSPNKNNTTNNIVKIIYPNSSSKDK